MLRGLLLVLAVLVSTSERVRAEPASYIPAASGIVSSLMGIVAALDPLAWGVLVGSLLMGVGFVWVIVDDRPIQARLLNGESSVGPGEEPAEAEKIADRSGQIPPDPGAEPGGPPRHRRRRRRAA